MWYKHKLNLENVAKKMESLTLSCKILSRLMTSTNFEFFLVIFSLASTNELEKPGIEKIFLRRKLEREG